MSQINKNLTLILINLRFYTCRRVLINCLKNRSRGENYNENFPIDTFIHHSPIKYEKCSLWLFCWTFNRFFPKTPKRFREFGHLSVPWVVLTHSHQSFRTLYSTLVKFDVLFPPETPPKKVDCMYISRNWHMNSNTILTPGSRFIYYWRRSLPEYHTTTSTRPSSHRSRITSPTVWYRTSVGRSKTYRMFESY